MIGTATAVVVTAARGTPAPAVAVIVAGGILASVGGVLLVRYARRARRRSWRWPYA